MGKAYANKKTKDKQPKNELYPTPLPLLVEMENLHLFNREDSILEPACGPNKNISKYLKALGYNVIERDLIYGDDFLESSEDEKFDWIITNPPFSLWDKFVEKAKNKADNVLMIGRTNYFGAYQRYKNGIWSNLKNLYVFNRQVAYDRFDEENLFHLLCGCLVTGWFHWDKNYKGEPTIKIIDVQKYCEGK